MKRLTTASLTLILCVFTVIPGALAQTDLAPIAGEATTDMLQSNQAYDKVTTHTFEEDEITSSFLRPENEQIQGQVHKKTRSMITLRRHFIPEMLKSVREL